MLRVIILHEPVNRKLLSYEREERSLQDVAIEIGIHDAIKDANLCGTMSTNPRPHEPSMDALALAFALSAHRSSGSKFAGTARETRNTHR